MMSRWLSPVVTSDAATPRRKYSAQPKGGVRNEVCKFTPIGTASQAWPTPALRKNGRNSGNAIKDISIHDEEAEHKDDRHEEPERRVDATGSEGGEIMHQLFAMQAAEGARKNLCAD
jgi:hypothetical protein